MKKKSIMVAVLLLLSSVLVMAGCGEEETTDGTYTVKEALSNEAFAVWYWVNFDSPFDDEYGELGMDDYVQEICVHSGDKIIEYRKPSSEIAWNSDSDGKSPENLGDFAELGDEAVIDMLESNPNLDTKEYTMDNLNLKIVTDESGNEAVGEFAVNFGPFIESISDSASGFIGYAQAFGSISNLHETPPCWCLVTHCDNPEKTEFILDEPGTEGTEIYDLTAEN